MIIIADAGSSKVEWGVVDAATGARTFETPGINAVMLGEEELRRAFGEALRGLQADAIYYYGAGCATEAVCAKVERALPRAPRVEVASDMLGAARALCGRGPGLVLILGTGSNSALYDGRALTANMPPMGFIVGDEGSGASFGRRLLREVYRTGRLRTELESRLGLGYGDILERIYRRPEANRFLASLMPFIVDRQAVLTDLIDAEFDALFRALASFYGPRRFSATGGVACALSDRLRESAGRHGFTLDQVQARPMPGLITFHSHETETN